MQDAMRVAQMCLHDVLYSTDVITSAHGGSVPGEVDEGITDNLTRTMVRELAATGCRDKVCAEVLEAYAVLAYLGIGLPSAGGVGWTVLEDKQDIGMDGRGTELELELVQALLQIPGVQVWQGTGEVVVEDGRK